MIARCQQATNDSKIKVEERGKKAIILNPARETYLRTRHDGCVVKNETGSDWVVSKEGYGDVFIELKGADVDHATEQIFCTAAHWVANQLVHGKLAGLIVASQYPKTDTKIQRAMLKFARLYKGPLRVVTRQGEFEFNKLFSF